MARICIAFIEKDTKALTSDGVYIELGTNAIRKILNYLKDVISS